MQIKYTTLFLLLAGTTAFSQIKVNQVSTVDTGSNAFLDASENTTGQGSNIGKGLLFPQTDLSTFTLKINAADGINYPTYFDGMIVYNTHEGDATTDPNLTTQTENLEKGFYYFSNPEGKNTQSIADGKWVRISDAQANASLWAQRQANGVTETYLKPALANNDFVGYKEDHKFSINLGNVPQNTSYGSYSPYNVGLSSDVLPTTSFAQSPDPNQYFFSQYSTILREPHVSTVPNDSWYSGFNFNFSTDEQLNSPQEGGIESLLLSSRHHSNSRVRYIAGAVSSIEVGNGTSNSILDKAQPVVASTIVKEGSSLKDMNLIRAFSQVKGGTVDNIRTFFGSIRSQSKDENGSYPIHTVKIMKGMESSITVSPNATVENVIMGTDSKVNISENVTMAADKRVYGNSNQVLVASALPQSDIFVNRNMFNLTTDGAEVRDLYLNQSVMYSKASTPTKVNRDMAAFNFWNAEKNNWTSDKMYGVYLDEIINGQTANYGLFIDNVGNTTSTNNYSIYTNKGDIRFGDLAETGAGDRIVIADENGVLKTSTTTSLNDFTEPDDKNRRAFKYSSSLGNTFTLGAGVRSFVYGKNSAFNNAHTHGFGHMMNYWIDNGTVGDEFRNTVGTNILEDNTGDYERIMGQKVESTQDGTGVLQDIFGSWIDARVNNGRVQTRLTGALIQANHNVNSNTQEATAVDAGVTYRGGDSNKVVSRSYGVRSRVAVAIDGVSGGNYPNWYGVQSSFSIPETFTGNVTNAYGFHYYFDESRATLDASKIDNLYGVYLSDVQGASNSNYAIYTNKGINRFGDDIKLSTTEEDTYSSTIGKALLSGAGLAFNVNTKVAATTLPINFIDFDFNNSVDNTQRGIVRFFRGTNLEGTKSVEVYKGNQSTDVVAKLAVGGHSFVANEQGFNFGVGTINPTEKLEVAGTVKATKFVATATGSVFPDYVFEKYYNGESKLNTNYDFKTLDQVEDFVKANGHLPGYVSAKEIKEAGQIDMTATQITNVEKIEELYLHTIEQEKKIEQQSKEIEELKSLVKQLLNK